MYCPIKCKRSKTIFFFSDFDIRSQVDRLKRKRTTCLASLRKWQSVCSSWLVKIELIENLPFVSANYHRILTHNSVSLLIPVNGNNRVIISYLLRDTRAKRWTNINLRSYRLWSHLWINRIVNINDRYY